jgi:cytoskeletal protein CcmA (bactofilin family)
MKNGITEPQARNIIAHGTSIKGDIDSSGDFRIEGTLVGTVKVKGKIVIGESGNVEGQIYCQSADISGSAKVKMEVSELTSLRANCKFEGDITTKKISIEPGALFSGNCQMGNTTSSTLNTDSANTEKFAQTTVKNKS